MSISLTQQPEPVLVLFLDYSRLKRHLCGLIADFSQLLNNWGLLVKDPLK